MEPTQESAKPFKMALLRACAQDSAAVFLQFLICQVGSPIYNTLAKMPAAAVKAWENLVPRNRRLQSAFHAAAHSGVLDALSWLAEAMMRPFLHSGEQSERTRKPLVWRC
eukprot:6467750-Amphidinium_carterae.1